jgi:phosphoribosylanthranilate isomerase
MKVKICCIKSVDEAQTAIEAGADVLGLVGPMPSGPGPITAKEAGSIVETLPGHIDSYYLTSKTHFESIAEEYLKVKSSHIQLTDHLEAGTRRQLKSEFPHLKIVQVVHVLANEDIDKAQVYAESSDLLLLDSGSPNTAVKELGGTGRTHNWTISKSIVEKVKIPIFLAGGLKSENVIQAIQTVQPYGLDLCSGVRTQDRLDQKKLELFMKTVRNV